MKLTQIKPCTNINIELNTKAQAVKLLAENRKKNLTFA